MAVTTVDAYGAPAYGPKKGHEGIVFHSPENPDITLASAIAIARWQATAANTSGGSYHGILAYDSTKGSVDNPNAWVMVRSVPWTQSAGGLMSGRDPAIWQPDRYPWIRAGMSAAGFSDPNAYLHQISLGGQAAWYASNGYPKGCLVRLAEWVIVLEDAYGYDALMSLHRMWQTNRSDPGPENLCDLVLAEYMILKGAPAPAPTPSTDAQRLADKDAALDRILTLRIPAARAALDQVEASVKHTRNI